MKSHPPRKFDIKSAFSKEEVRQAFNKDGAVVLSNLFPLDSSSWQDIAAQVPHLVWESQDLLLQQHRADAVHEEHQKLSLAGEALHPHSDGYIWGDKYPDLVILSCEEPAGENQGANYLIDGYDVVARLDSTTKAFLEKTLIDHTERSETAYVNGAESIVPVVRWLEPRGWRQNESENRETSRRLCWRRMIGKDFAGKQVEDKETGEVQYASLWAPVQESEDKEAVKEALHELDRAIAAEGHESLRFTLAKGEALIVDNFRMLHSREAFHGLDHKRRMWRVWSWTNASFGLPPQVVASNENKEFNLPSNILDAEKSIQAET
eukprot:scaffold3651_cov156-Amphora_coffeaeformis.AAC.3